MNTIITEENISEFFSDSDIKNIDIFEDAIKNEDYELANDTYEKYHEKIIYTYIFILIKQNPSPSIIKLLKKCLNNEDLWSSEIVETIKHAIEYHKEYLLYIEELIGNIWIDTSSIIEFLIKCDKYKPKEILPIVTILLQDSRTKNYIHEVFIWTIENKFDDLLEKLIKNKEYFISVSDFTHYLCDKNIDGYSIFKKYLQYRNIFNVKEIFNRVYIDYIIIIIDELLKDPLLDFNNQSSYIFIYIHYHCPLKNMYSIIKKLIKDPRIDPVMILTMNINKHYILSSIEVIHLLLQNPKIRTLYENTEDLLKNETIRIKNISDCLIELPSDVLIEIIEYKQSPFTTSEIKNIIDRKYKI